VDKQICLSFYDKAGEAILTEIASKCYYTEYFKWDQSKRILQFIKDSYNAEPEFLWSSLPGCAALRVPGKKPWFAVICEINYLREGERVCQRKRPP